MFCAKIFLISLGKPNEESITVQFRFSGFQVFIKKKGNKVG